MLGNRARSWQSKFFFETQRPFLLLLILPLLLLFVPEHRAAIEIETTSKRFLIFFTAREHKCDPLAVRAHRMSFDEKTSVTLCVFF